MCGVYEVHVCICECFSCKIKGIKNMVIMNRLFRLSTICFASKCITTSCFYTIITFNVYSRHDQQLVAKLKSLPKTTGSGTNKPLPTQQFGVSLQYIKDANNQDPIPPVLKNCITFLDHPDGKIHCSCTVVFNSSWI